MPTIPTERARIQYWKTGSGPAVILVQGAKDTLVKTERVRPWADEMKKLKMTYEYLEIADGDHINVAFTSLPRIFEFFAKHRRAVAPKQ